MHNVEICIFLTLFMKYICTCTCVHVCDLSFERGRFPANRFDQTLTSMGCHFVQLVNGFLYPARAIITLLR